MAPPTIVDYYIVLKYIYLHLRTSTRPVVNWSWSEPVQTGLVTAKDCKRLVYTGPVQFFVGFGFLRTGLSLGLRRLRQKTETGLDFQTLLDMWLLVVTEYRQALPFIWLRAALDRSGITLSLWTPEYWLHWMFFLEINWKSSTWWTSDGGGMGKHSQLLLAGQHREACQHEANRCDSTAEAHPGVLQTWSWPWLWHLHKGLHQGLQQQVEVGAAHPVAGPFQRCYPRWWVVLISHMDWPFLRSAPMCTIPRKQSSWGRNTTEIRSFCSVKKTYVMGNNCFHEIHDRSHMSSSNNKDIIKEQWIEVI